MILAQSYLLYSYITDTIEADNYLTMYCVQLYNINLLFKKTIKLIFPRVLLIKIGT